MTKLGTFNFPIAGYAIEIGPETNPNWFTGSGYSSELQDAKLFVTRSGAMNASRIWQEADYNPNPLPKVWYAGRRPVELSFVKRVQ